MYFQDLSTYKYDKYNYPKLDVETLAIGWLNSKPDYNTGPVSDAFLSRLELFCITPALVFFSHNDCPICQSYPTGYENIPLGSGELRIMGQGKVVYAAPVMIYHYIINHHYQPPAEFMDAILNFPLPDSIEYETFTNNYH